MWKSTTFALVFAVPVMTKGGCDGCDPSTDPVDTGVDVDTDDTDTGTVDVCDSYSAQATDAALAATPRPRPELEQLAIQLFPSFTANPTTYARLVADLAAIGTDPNVAGVTYRPAWRGDQLIVGMDAATLATVVDGTYTAWDCANDAYEIEDINPGGGYALLTFDGTYDIEALADEYALFAGVTYAEPNHTMGSGSTVCVVPDGDTWHWRIDEGSGDCPAGCINHEYSYFVTQANGSVASHGSWANDMPPMTRPAWMDTFEDCQ